MILTEGAGKFGRLLWAMNWQAKVDRLGPDMPEYTDEDFGRVQPVRRKGALGPPDQHRPRRRPDRLRRRLPGGSGDAVVERLDGDVRRLLRAPEPDGTSLLRSGTTTSRVVQACVCGGGCTDIATISLPERSRGHAQLSVSGNGSVAVVSFTAWGLGSAPTGPYPDIECLSLTGQVLATLPHGLAEVDATGQMVVLQEGRARAGRAGACRHRQSGHGRSHLGRTRVAPRVRLRVAAGDQSCQIRGGAPAQGRPLFGATR